MSFVRKMTIMYWNNNLMKLDEQQQDATLGQREPESRLKQQTIKAHHTGW